MPSYQRSLPDLLTHTAGLLPGVLVSFSNPRSLPYGDRATLSPRGGPVPLTCTVRAGTAASRGAPAEWPEDWVLWAEPAPSRPVRVWASGTQWPFCGPAFAGEPRQARGREPARLPTLKLVVSNVGQVNSRGKTMYMGTDRLRQTSPSAI